MLEDIDFSEHLGDLNLRAIKFKKNVKKRFRPFEPDSTFKTSWDIFGMFLILYEAIFIPYRVSFNIPIEGLFLMFAFFIDCFFITDIAINFYTGFYKKGNLVMVRYIYMC
jgi:hypothetical protein